MAALDLSLNNPVVQSYIVYSAILAVKLLALGPLTGMTRLAKGVYANPEDAKALRGKVKADEKVERYRRAHRNDLENIPVFWILGALYLTTGPNVTWAILLFRVYTLARVAHTVVYALVPMPQPLRGISYMVAISVMFYMGFMVLLHYITAL